MNAEGETPQYRSRTGRLHKWRELSALFACKELELPPAALETVRVPGLSWWSCLSVLNELTDYGLCSLMVMAQEVPDIVWKTPWNKESDHRDKGRSNLWFLLMFFLEDYDHMTKLFGGASTHTGFRPQLWKMISNFWKRNWKGHETFNSLGWKPRLAGHLEVDCCSSCTSHKWGSSCLPECSLHMWFELDSGYVTGLVRYRTTFSKHWSPPTGLTSSGYVAGKVSGRVYHRNEWKV